MSYFVSTNTIDWLESEYKANSDMNNCHPLKQFKILNGNYQFNNILDVYQKTK